MIQKHWSDIQIYNYCKHNMITESYNEYNKKPFYKEFITKFISLEDVKLLKLKKWAIDNCCGHWKLCKFHPGYGNYIVFKFSDVEDFKAFDRLYDKLVHPKIDVLM